MKTHINIFIPKPLTSEKKAVESSRSRPNWSEMIKLFLYISRIYAALNDTLVFSMVLLYWLAQYAAHLLELNPSKDQKYKYLSELKLSI